MNDRSDTLATVFLKVSVFLQFRVWMRIGLRLKTHGVLRAQNSHHQSWLPCHSFACVLLSSLPLAFHHRSLHSLHGLSHHRVQ